MNAGVALSKRQRVAQHTPGVLRRLVRMGEHYARRQWDWVSLLQAARGVSAGDRLTLMASAMAAPVTALGQLDGFGSPVLLKDVDVRVTEVGTLRLRRGTDDPIHVLRAREPHVWDVLDRMLQPGDTFIDAGANIGFYALRAAQLVGAAGKVVAVEMMPETAATLRANVAASGATNVSVVERALTARAAETVTASSDPAKLGQASIAFAPDGERRMTVAVGTTTLDSIAPEGPIALIKMDLEGAELDALRGASALLRRTKAIVFENNGADQRIAQLLAAAGFRIFQVAAHDYLAERESFGKDR